MIRVRVQQDKFDVDAEIAELKQGRADVGAIVVFLGLCRDEDGALEALEIEHYPKMAESEIERVASEASRRWALHGVVAVHRHGLIRVGEEIVLVATAATHRRDAFEAAEFLMDYLKTAAPFWKREHERGGSVGAWVAAAAQDEESVQRWR